MKFVVGTCVCFIFLISLVDIGVNSQYSYGIHNITPSAKTCFKCDTSDGSGGDCLHKPTDTCTVGESYNYCYIHSEFVDKKIVRRGCVGDKSVGSPTSCHDPQTCVVCSSEDRCNNREIQIEHCIKTEYSVNNPPNDQLSVECPLSLEPMGCYHFERKGQVEKGCMSGLNITVQHEILSSKDCEICFGQNCNSKFSRFRKCIFCDGTTNANCVDDPNLASTIDCDEPCLVGIDINGYTHRQCASNQTIDFQRFPKGFETCQNDTCNRNIFPNNHLKCFQCKGEPDCSLKNSNGTPQHSTGCQIYSKVDECYTHFSTNGSVFRGCMSDPTNNKNVCDDAEGKCLICTKNNCNNQRSSSGENAPNLSTALIFSIAVLSILK